MIRRVAIVVCALAVVGCSANSRPRSAGSTPAPDATRSSTTTTTTTTTVPTTVALSPAASPGEAATAFVNAWRDGNRLAALTIALPAAVDSVFDAGEPGPAQNRGCNRPPPDSPVLCVYKTAVGELQVRVQPTPDGWIVDQAIVSPA